MVYRPIYIYVLTPIDFYSAAVLRAHASVFCKIYERVIKDQMVA